MGEMAMGRFSETEMGKERVQERNMPLTFRGRRKYDRRYGSTIKSVWERNIWREDVDVGRNILSPSSGLKCTC
jgi:hypothetical protein